MNVKTTSCAVLFLLPCILQIGAIQAQDNDEALWKKLDITEDGWLDGKELEGGWLRFDTNDDKEVTKAEFLAGRAKARSAQAVSPEEAAKVFKRLDASGNGYLSGTELDGENARAYDANGDNRVTLEEFVAGYTKQNLAATAPKAPLPTVTTPPQTAPQTLKAASVPAPAKPLNLAPLNAKAGYIIGRVVTESGAPVPSFTIDYSGFEKGKLANYSVGGGLIETINSEFKGTNGDYQIKVPNGAYRASGYVTYNYKGRVYHFELEPLNPPARHDYEGSGLDELKGGLVRDFVLKMTAKKAGASEATETVYTYAYYGGRVDLYAGEHEGILGGGNKLTTPLRNAFPPDSRVEITLTPQGPRVDGSTGQPVIGNLRLGDDGKYSFMMRGVFPGVYTATARLATPDGQIMPLRLSLKSADTIRKGAGDYDKLVVDWKPSVTVDFLPNDIGPAPRKGVKAVRLYLGQ